jgi:hypothetical protein
MRACRVCSCRNQNVDCRGKKISFLPTEFPSDAKVIDLSENVLINVPIEKFQTLMKLTKLRVLNMSVTGISDWQNLSPT